MTERVLSESGTARPTSLLDDRVGREERRSRWKALSREGVEISRQHGLKEKMKLK
jgi:hypothetical protein